MDQPTFTELMTSSHWDDLMLKAWQQQQVQQQEQQQKCMEPGLLTSASMGQGSMLNMNVDKMASPMYTGHLNQQTLHESYMSRQPFNGLNINQPLYTPLHPFYEAYSFYYRNGPFLPASHELQRSSQNDNSESSNQVDSRFKSRVNLVDNFTQTDSFSQMSGIENYDQDQSGPIVKATGTNHMVFGAEHNDAKDKPHIQPIKLDCEDNQKRMNGTASVQNESMTCSEDSDEENVTEQETFGFENYTSDSGIDVSPRKGGERISLKSTDRCIDKDEIKFNRMRTAPAKRKKKQPNRAKFTVEQLAEFEKVFKKDPHPQTKYHQLAERMNLTYQQVYLWFKNKRARVKRMKNKVK